MVVSKAIFAKIDRPKGIISFRRRKEDINGLLDLLEKSCHLIQRENMVYKIDQTTRA
jgi:26S proteasome regulatory subunit N5